MDPAEDLYRVLGVHPGAEPAAIKQAYRRLSMEHHPDRKPGDASATATFARLSQAYEILGNPVMRREYDEGRVGADGRKQPAYPGIPKEYFAAMFGGGVQADQFGNDLRVFHRPGASQGSFIRSGPGGQFRSVHACVPDLEARVRVSLEKAYSGCTVPLAVRRFIREGQSEREEKETLYMPVPKGIDNDEIIRLEGKGNILDGRAGAVKVFVDVDNHTDLRRDGLDLVYTCSIGLKEALTGPSFEIQHLDGRTLRMKGSGSVIGPGSKKVLKGLGMIRDGEKGNLVVEYNVIFPTRLTKEQLKALNEIL